MRTQIAASLCLAGAVCLTVTTTSAVTPYTITDLGTLGGTYSTAYGINNLGQVVGMSGLASGESHAFLWDSGVMTDLGALDGNLSYAYDVNEHGQIVGWAGTNLVADAFVWDSGTMTAIFPPEADNSWAYGINDAGEVVGGGPQGAFLWDDGVISNLGVPGRATSINNSGQIAGIRRLQPTSNGFIWQDGNLTLLGALGGISSWAYDINDSGVVVGAAQIPDGEWHAYILEDEVMTDLGTYSGRKSYAEAVNNEGLVAGYSDGRAVMWEDGTLHDLNDLIPSDSNWFLMHAFDINDAGQIVGYGYVDGLILNRAFLLTPIPEPAALSLAAIAALCLLTRRRTS